MDSADLEILHAIEQTRVFRQPRQKLASFGATVLRYYLLTEPAYASVVEGGAPETVIREGTVTAQRPAIVTPGYMLNMEGFGVEARKSMEYLSRLYGSQSPGLMYAYKNDAAAMTIIPGKVDPVADRVAGDLDKAGTDLAVVIIGVDGLWDVSLLKFIYDFTAASFQENVQHLQLRGLLDPDPSLGIPRGSLREIESLFQAVERGQADPAVLKAELDRWDLFDRYQDRFLALFKRRGYR